MGERGRARASAGERKQRLLPIEQVAESDGAYLASLDSAGLPDGVARLVRWLILEGRREAGEKRLPVRPQRQLAERLGVSPSTVCGALDRLASSGLVVQADGEYRLRLGLMVAIGEEAETRRQQAAVSVDPAAALDLLTGGGARSRSAALDGARACSGALGGVDTCSSKEIYKTRVPVLRAVSRGGSSAEDQLPAMPWAKVGGITSEQLRAAVLDRDEHLLTGLYWAGCEKGWWDDCEAYRVTFLAAAWQAVESAKKSPMGLLHHLVKVFLRPAADGERRRGLTAAADDWAAETRRLWNRRRAEETEANRDRHPATCGIPSVG